jgi:hypothetical protein
MSWVKELWAIAHQKACVKISMTGFGGNKTVTKVSKHTLIPLAIWTIYACILI